METFLINFSETHRFLAHLALFFGMFVEGEFLLILAGVLVRSGNLDFFDVLFVSYLGAFSHDVLWWFAGKKFSDAGRKKFLFINIAKYDFLSDKIRERNGFYIFISKFAWAFNKLFLFLSGRLKVPFKTLVKYSIPAVFIWTTGFLSFGYFFAHQTDVLKKDVKTALISISVFFFVIFFLEYMFRRALKKPVKKT